MRTAKTSSEQTPQQRQNISKTLRALKALKAAGAKTAAAAAAKNPNQTPATTPRAFQALQTLKAKANAGVRPGMYKVHLLKGEKNLCFLSSKKNSLLESIYNCFELNTTKELLIEEPSEIFIRGMSPIFFKYGYI